MSTTSIPSHYSDNYVHRRYNRALQIVQHLPNHFQPSKEQKLKLYAYYKQVTNGDIDTPRPGLFDIVGRAKWDSWDNIKGMTKLEAEHKYVETLLKTVSDAFQNPVCRTQAQQILQIFATMKPTDGDDDTTDDDITTTDHDDTDNTNDDDNDIDEDSSEGSIDEEEKAYLYEIQQNAGRSTPGTVFRQRKKKKRRVITPLVPSSSISPPHQRFLQHSNSSQQSLDRPITPSAYSKRSFNNQNNKLPLSNVASPLSKPTLSSSTNNNNNNANSTNGNEVHIVPPRDSPYYDDDDRFDNTVNPWVAVSASSTSATTTTAVHPKRHDQNTPPLLLSRSLSPNTTITSTTTTTTPLDYRRQSDSRATNHSGISSVQHLPSPILGRPNSRLKNHLNSPFQGSSTSSSVTATFSNTRSTLQRYQQFNQSNINNPSLSSMNTTTSTNNIDNNNTSITTLSPETKRALQSLQAEVIALNDRIDDLRHELLRRDKQRYLNSSSKDKKDKDGDGWEESWRWVINAALKYFAVNIISASIMFLILYKRNNTVAYVIIDEFSKVWHKVKLKLKITGVVV